MKGTLRVGLPVAVLGAVIVVGVLLATTPWSGEEAVQEAPSGTVKHRLCDVVLEAPPAAAPQPGQERLGVLRMVSVEAYDAEPFDPHPTLTLEPELELQIRGAIRSTVLVDATTGTVSLEDYGTPSHEATLQGILDTLRLEPFNPATAPWPYTDTSQEPPKRAKHGIFEYRLPDPASGIVASQRLANTTAGAVHGFILANCRSVEMISFDPFTGEEREGERIRDIHPDDEAAFKVFLDEPGVEALPY